MLENLLSKPIKYTNSKPAHNNESFSKLIPVLNFASNRDLSIKKVTFNCSVPIYGLFLIGNVNNVMKKILTLIKMIVWIFLAK